MSGEELPRRWTWTTLASVIDDGPTNGYSGPVGEGGTPTLKLSATTSGTMIISDDTTKFLTETLPPNSGALLRTGDLLVQRANSLQHIGASAIYDGPPGAYAYPDLMMRVRIGEPSLRRFTWFWLNSEPCRRYFRDNATGTAGNMPKISGTTLRNAPLPLPPLPEQRRIVAKLDELRARSRKAREALDEVPALLDKLKQSVLAAAFRGDLTAEWRAAQPPGSMEPASVLLERIRAERRKRWEQANPKKEYVEPEPVDTEGLPELPEGWCWAALGEVIEGYEAGRSPKTHGRPASGDEFGVLKVSAMTWGAFDPNENKAMLAGDIPGPGTTIRQGDLLISRANTVALVGAVVLVSQDHPNLMLSDKSLRIRYLPGIDPRYLLWALRTRIVRRVFEDDATGTSDSMRNLSQGKLSSAPIALAPAAEQATLADVISRLHTLIRAMRDDAAHMGIDLTSLDQSLLAKAFRGELVPQDPNDEPAEQLLARIRAEAANSAPRRRGRRTGAEDG